MRTATNIDRVTPYNQTESKKVQVEHMFDAIAGKYDFLNHFLSFGIDKGWRRKLIRKLRKCPHKIILDVATGTGDLAIMASKLNPEKIEGIDLSEKMLEVGRVKLNKLNLSKVIRLTKGDAENLVFEDNYFDAAMVSFGVRNFENLEKGLREINRVLKPGGTLFVLEFSKPRIFPVKQLYHFYSKTILPIAGKQISGDNKAYTYLPASVQAFPEGGQFVDILTKSGYKNSGYNPLTFRIATIYTAVK